MNDKEKWENPASDIPEDAVSPGSILPKPARADSVAPEVRSPETRGREVGAPEVGGPDVRPRANDPLPIIDRNQGAAGQPSTAKAADTFAADAQDRLAETPIIAKPKPKPGRRILGLCVAAVIGAAAVLGYQYFGPKPEVESFAACVDRSVPNLQAVDGQKLSVILLPLINDAENIQSGLVQSALETFEGSDGPLIQVQTVDCALVDDAGSLLKLASIASENSVEIARKTGADVLIWGEVLPDDQLLELRMNYPVDSGRAHFATDQLALKTDFGTDQETVFAAKIWSMSTVVDRLDADSISDGMAATLEALTPISVNPKPELSLQQLGNLYHALGDAEYVLGLQTEDSNRLESAIDHYRSAAEMFERYRFTDDWARNQNDMGVALTALGKKDNRNQEIGLAITALQDAIVEMPRSRAPLMWAQLQGHLAEALNTLGTRDANNQMLADAVSAYRLALTVQDRENYPVQWGTTQHNLGAALQALGQRAGDPAILEDAVIAYRAALEVRTAENLPKDHAITQINLGSTLMSLGARAQNTELVSEAVVAYRAAIDQLDKENSVIEWATAQHSLGNALALLAEQNDSTDNLDAALMAFSLALESFDRQTDPTRWAVTQNNIGNVLHTMGDRRRDPEAVIAAIAAYEAAVSVLSETAPAYAERVVESLARAQVLQQTIAQSN
ncbi:tetratricopeptide repeat protein [Pararhizobium sp. IMCC21322]|uniref:tetratricopeptide repeat protein n=1 Tax=Pararhizobium sp. IMCC21322 TaxID=3067903 RepID=UPI0027420CDD|nr:tetratricopeptide repeat protein [Pararhizobium sp. IMCC21322]